MHLVCRLLWPVLYPMLKLLEPSIQQWVMLTTQLFVPSTFADLVRRRSELILEAFLRQQVSVLSRQKKRPPRFLFLLCE